MNTTRTACDNRFDFANEKLFNFAYKTAQRSDLVHHKVVAIVVDKMHCGKYFFGYNRRIHGYQKNHIFSIHAEANLVAKAAKKGFSLDGATVLIYRKKFIGVGTSKPCHDCHGLLVNAGVRTIIYYDGNKWIKDKI
jgi:tRNA(Arg) A34 adenosine deaminase TadA